MMADCILDYCKARVSDFKPSPSERTAYERYIYIYIYIGPPLMGRSLCKVSSHQQLN